MAPAAAPPPPSNNNSSSSSFPVRHYFTTRSILSSIVIFVSGFSFALTISATFNVSNYYLPPPRAGHHDNDHQAPPVVVTTVSCRCVDDVSRPRLFDNVTNSHDDAERQKTKELHETILQLQQQHQQHQIHGQMNILTKTTTDSKNISSRSMTSILRDRLLLQSGSSSHRRHHDNTRAFSNSLLDTGEGNNDDADDDDDDDNICSILSQPTPSILSLWSSHLPHVFNASRHSADPTYIFHDFTAQLLHLMSPDRLQRSIKTLPLDWTPVGRALDIVHRRLTSIYDEIQSYKIQHNLQKEDEDTDDDIMIRSMPPDEIKRINANPTHPRKLNILVMGGSVTMGVVCHINPVTTSTGKYSRRDCAWPGRLSTFFTNLFGGYDLINVHTATLGGTNTESGITIWDYSLLPDDVPYPDIVINAYATNDMHYNTVQDAIRRNVTLGESLLAMGQDFVRLVLTPKSSTASGCASRAPPLLLYVDDYLGNEQNEILTTMMSSQTINLLSGYYGVGSMSYGDAIRDIVYGDTKEWWFSSDWYEKGKSQYQRAVHPHMGMHISMVWVVAYNLLNLVTSFCSLPKIKSDMQLGRRRQWRRRNARYHAGIESSSEGVWDYGYSNSMMDGDLPSLQGTHELVGGPRRKPRGLPPLLTPELSLEHVTELWMNESNVYSHLWRTDDECLDLGANSSQEKYYDKPCLYSWVANLERKLDNTQRIADRLKPYITSNKGWGAVDDNSKLGWAPTSGIGSSFTMEWKNITRPVRAVTWMIMRSYGEKWNDSLLKVEVLSDETLMAKRDIEGFHNKKTSETYNIKMKLFDNDEGQGGGDGVVTGSDLKIIFTLVGGSTFKISGMAICDH